MCLMIVDDYGKIIDQFKSFVTRDHNRLRGRMTFMDTYTLYTQYYTRSLIVQQHMIENGLTQLY